MSFSLNPIDWFAEALVKNKPVADAAINISPVGALYGVGAGINAATGGETPYRSLSESQGPAPVSYSPLTQWASGHLGQPGQGTWNVPVFNAGLPAGAGNAAASIIKGALGIAADALGDWGKWVVPAAVVGGAAYLLAGDE